MASKKSVSVKSAAKAPTAAKSKSNAKTTAKTKTTVRTKATTAVRKSAAPNKSSVPKKKSAVAKKSAARPLKKAARTAVAKTSLATAATGAARKKTAANAKPVVKATAAKKPAAKRVAAAKPAVAKPAAKKTAVKPVAKSAAASRTKSASAVAARRARPAAATGQATRDTKSKPNLKAVAAAVRKPIAKQSTPIAAPTAKSAAALAAKKPANQRHGFKVNEFIVYPAHGVGQIVALEEQEIAGVTLELFVITFEKDKMTVKVPVGKHGNGGMRKLAESDVLEKAMTTLKGRARVKRTMWSRRAQEYEAKINSGDLVSIAEVVRDLYRSETQPEQSYSERQLYEQALDRMARELAAVEKLDERGAVQRITEVLAKSAKGRRAAEEAAEAANVEAA